MTDEHSCPKKQPTFAQKPDLDKRYIYLVN